MVRAVSESLDTVYGWMSQPLVAVSLRVALILVLALLVVAVAARLIERADRKIVEQLEAGPNEGLKRRRTFGNVVRYATSVFVFGVATLSILRELGLDLAPILAGAGVAGIVIGLGTQNLMRDFLGGLLVLIEGQYGVGDFVRVGGVSGTVEKVTLRMTQLRDSHGNVHIVPNGHGSVVTNETREWSRALLDVDVAYKEDVDRVMDVLAEIGAELSADPAWGPKLLEPVTIPGLQSLGESGVSIRTFFKTMPTEKFNVMRELRRRIKIRFDAEGIEIPFPQRTVHVQDLRAAPAGAERPGS